MTRQIKVGGVKIGGGAPISIQSMAKTDTRDVVATVRQIKELEKAGCEIVRVAIKDFEAARAINGIKKKIRIPLVADIHFDYRLALIAIENGADKIRLNPGNICKKEEVKEIVKSAKKRRIPIRVGMNSGSLPVQLRKLPRWATCEVGQGIEERMVKSALDYIKVLERMDFYDIIVSLKASDVVSTIEAYRQFSKKSKYPLHLGITAAGPVTTGIIKSSIGIGALLLDGIGDTIRVSLTGSAIEEVIAAKNILQALNLRNFGPEIISCPTCGRCQVDLQGIVKEIELGVRCHVTGNRYSLATRCKSKVARDRQVSGKNKNHMLKIAIMGCEVNGPGEAREADIGVAFGKGAGVLFKKGRIVKRIKEKDAINMIIAELTRKPLHLRGGNFSTA